MSREIFEQWTEGDKKMDKCEWVNGELKKCHNLAVAEITITTTEASGGTIKFCPYCGEPLRRPIQVGMFGKFNDDDGEYQYNTLIRINPSGEYKYKTASDVNYLHFTPGLPEGFNQDGTKNDML